MKWFELKKKTNLLLYLCLPVANYSAESEFSNWKRVRIHVCHERSTLKHIKINTIERLLLKKINIDKIIVVSKKEKKIYLTVIFKYCIFILTFK
jgi:hypothetical protein